MTGSFFQKSRVLQTVFTLVGLAATAHPAQLANRQLHPYPSFAPGATPNNITMYAPIEAVRRTARAQPGGIAPL